MHIKQSTDNVITTQQLLQKQLAYKNRKIITNIQTQHGTN